MYSIQNQLFLPTLRSDYPAILLTSFALVFKARSEVFDGLSFMLTFKFGVSYRVESRWQVSEVGRS